MKIKTLDDRLLYVPNPKKGYSEFKGEPLPDQAVMDLIGQEGVSFIAEKLKQLVKMRIELFGNGMIRNYGMRNFQMFFDLKTRTVIKVEDILKDSDKGLFTYFDMPEPSNYTLTLGEITDKTKFRHASNIGLFRKIKLGFDLPFK